MLETTKPQKGIWTLTAPDGTEYKEESPLKCARAEQKIRIPDDVAAARVAAYLNLCDLCEEADFEFILAKDTPAELAVCATCKNTIFQHSVQVASRQ